MALSSFGLLNCTTENYFHFCQPSPTNMKLCCALLLLQVATTMSLHLMVAEIFVTNSSVENFIESGGETRVRACDGDGDDCRYQSTWYHVFDICFKTDVWQKLKMRGDGRCYGFLKFATKEECESYDGILGSASSCPHGSQKIILDACASKSTRMERVGIPHTHFRS